MNQNERAQHIIQDLMSIPQGRWLRTNYGGQGVFEVRGVAGYVLYFSRSLMDPSSQHPDRDAALEQHQLRLNERSYAIEVFDEDCECVCLLRFDDLNEIEVVEYCHGTWETASFGLPPQSEAFSPSIH